MIQSLILAFINRRHSCHRLHPERETCLQRIRTSNMGHYIEHYIAERTADKTSSDRLPVVWFMLRSSWISIIDDKVGSHNCRTGNVCCWLRQPALLIYGINLQDVAVDGSGCLACSMLTFVSTGGRYAIAMCIPTGCDDEIYLCRAHV